MNDAAVAVATDRIKALVVKWAPILGFSDWTIEIVYDRNGDVRETMNSTEQWQSIASTTDKWEYRDLKIQFNLQAIEGMEDERLERTVIHEFMHGVLGVMREACDDYQKHEEMTARWLELAFMRAHYAGHQPNIIHVVKE